MTADVTPAELRRTADVSSNEELLRDALYDAADRIEQLERDLATAQVALAACREALEWYADWTNHVRTFDNHMVEYVPVIRDCGERARVCLAAMEREGE